LTCIRGAGIVGRTLALLAARERLRVALVAPPGGTPAAADVRAYAIGPAVQALLQSLRCWPEGVAATPVLAMQVQADRQGSVRFSAQQQGVAALAWIVDVPRLEQRLAEAVRYQSAIDVLRRPWPRPDGGLRRPRQRTRAEFGVEFDSVPYPSTPWPPGWTASARTAGGAPVVHPRATSWPFCPWAARTGARWRWSGRWPASAPSRSGLGRRRAGRAPARAERRRPGRAAGAGRACQLAAGAGRARRWVGAMPGRVGESWALAGDAAHAMHPLAGQGLNVGLGDAAELARVLAARERWRSVADLRLLRRYERARQGHWLRMRWATDGLQLLFGPRAAGRAAAQLGHDAVRPQRPDQVAPGPPGDASLSGEPSAPWRCPSLSPLSIHLLKKNHP
jgi:2-polyprenyl-6-methoxyphenol hydroxylase-like FAD-dependent oxidoreductase